MITDEQRHEVAQELRRQAVYCPECGMKVDE